MKNFEQIGSFYLGRRVDPETHETLPEPLLYDAKDLTTHALIVGMTGSGKTGLGIAMLEEAAIDGVPVIAIDPKGDLGNLLLTFPRLRPEDFEPWIEAGEAARHGRSVSEQARETAQQWRSGLSDWGQEPARIGRFADAAERVIYTPGGTAGRRVRVLRSFEAPPPELRADDEALRDRTLAAVSGLLGLLGIDADPLRSREHVLLSTILDAAWRAGQDVDIPTLIRRVQKPPFDRVGVMDLETVFPSRDRMDLAMALNNLLASPGFAAWAEGEALSIPRLLWAEDGRPRISIMNIAHLGDRERMFFVTLLLSEILAWIRSQPGSSTLRAILYMDEVFGYFPPTANPPSKTPMLTLLKQGRAFGLGCVLATQNPVDLDYKGMSNAGSWFIGRLQTERDKARLLDGLEGASAGAGAAFDRAAMERTVSGLGSRRFLLNNVHEDAPVLFETRWVLSYLGGPMARDQIQRLTASPVADPAPAPEVAATAAPASAPAAGGEPARERPLLPDGAREAFLPVTSPPGPGETLVYRPALLGVATLHYVNARAQVDEWQRAAWLAPVPDAAGSPWKQASELAGSIPELAEDPDGGARFEEAPAAALRAATWKRWSKQLMGHAHRARPMQLFTCGNPRLVSRPGEEEGAFRGRVREALRGARDVEIEKLRRRYAPKLATLQDQIRRAEQRVDVEREQYDQKKMQAAVSIGRTVLGAIFGRKLGSVGNVGRAGTAIDRSTRAARERGDIARAVERLESLREKLEALEARFDADVTPLQDPVGPAEIDVRSLPVTPRKTDLEIESLLLVWVPWRIDAAGLAHPAHGVAPQPAR